MILGSSNVDVFFPASSSASPFPSPGENLIVDDAGGRVLPGGKGLNQARGLCELAMADATFITCFPAESALSGVLSDALRKSNVTARVLQPRSCSVPGIGCVFPSKDDVCAIVMTNSNSDFDESEAERAIREECADAKLLMLQNEIPSNLNTLALRSSPPSCASIYDLGGSSDISVPIDANVTMITMNEIEMFRWVMQSIN